MSKTIYELLKFLACAKFEEANKFLVENEKLINRESCDNNGNTLMHWAIYGLVFKLEDIWKEYKNSSHSGNAFDKPK